MRTPRGRRVVLAALSGTAVVALTLSGCGNSRGGTASSASSASCNPSAYKGANINWKQYSGQSITVAAESHPWWSTVAPLLPCFKQLTGIDVKPDVLGEDQYVSRVAVELSSGSPTPDVFMINQFGQAAKSRWLEPLDSYLGDSKKTDAGWSKPNDFFPGATAFSQADGKHMALPLTAEIEMLYVRTDLVPNPPTTMEQLAQAAAAAKKNGVAGFSARAVASSSQSPWSYAGFSFSGGAQLLDANGQPHFDTPKNVAALTTYANLIKNDGPAGASGWGFLENQQAMQQGKLAMWTDSSSLLGSIKNPSTSTVADKVAVYPFPSGGAGSVPNLYYWTIGMNSKSTHKDAAWMFMQWATSSPISTAAGANGASPARSSAWDAPSSSTLIGKDNADRIRQALKQADSTEFSNTWKQTNWSQMADPLARAINAAVSGSDPATELQTAQKAAKGMVQ
jgi:multiple sugar transport system substrate-binding protein